ncbi:MAG: tetratricopeptide repeat protein [Aminivibrio sp.]|jgi:hypothetical protein
MRKSKFIISALLLFSLIVPLLFGGKPAYGNGVIVTEPEGAKSVPVKKTKPVKKAPAPHKAPAPNQAPAQPTVPPKNLALEEGLRLLELRFFTKALAQLEQAVLQEPGNASAWYALGRACQEKGFFIKAQAAYKNALEIDPYFKPLSRAMPYPSNDGRIPLWDPKRPPRMEDIPVNTQPSPELGNSLNAGDPGPVPATIKAAQTNEKPSEASQTSLKAVPVKDGKLRPFVPVRIVKAADENGDGKFEDPPEGLAKPVYIPPDPPEF